MIRLTNTTQKLQAVLAGSITTNQLQVTVSYSDKTSTTYDGGSQLAVTNNTTAVDICAAPAASTIRDVDYISVYNADTVAATVSIIFDNNSTDYTIIKQSLAAGEQLVYVHGSGWSVTQLQSVTLGSMATQNASAVSITGGSISGITDLAVADGGTGASTGAQALINLGERTGATGAVILPVGTTAQRPTPAAGYIRFNDDLDQFEGYNGTAWSSVGGGATGGGADRVFMENDQTVTTNYTITTNRNAVTAGPITINSGVSVVIPSGSTWHIL